MQKPKAPFAFLLRHAVDVWSLAQQLDRPKAVSEDDWAKFNEVVALASQETAGLVFDARDRAVAELADVLTPVGKGPRFSTVAGNPDAWIRFKGPGKKNKQPVGSLGAFLHPTSGGMLLLGYVRPLESASVAGLRAQVARAKYTAPADLPLHDDTVVLIDVMVTENSDLDAVVGECAAGFARQRAVIAALTATG